MRVLAFIPTLIAAGLLTACGADPDNITEIEEARPEDVESNAPANFVASEDDDIFSPLDPVTEEACDGDPAEIAQIIPDQSSFTSMSASGITVVACAFDGRRDFWSIDVTSLPVDDRVAFQTVITDHLRRGTFQGDDRTQSGIFRKRDGGLCAVQIDPAVARPVCDSARQAQSRLDAQN